MQYNLLRFHTVLLCWISIHVDPYKLFAQILFVISRYITVNIYHIYKSRYLMDYSNKFRSASWLKRIEIISLMSLIYIKCLWNSEKILTNIIENMQIITQNMYVGTSGGNDRNEFHILKYIFSKFHCFRYLIWYM